MRIRLLLLCLAGLIVVAGWRQVTRSNRLRPQPNPLTAWRSAAEDLERRLALTPGDAATRSELARVYFVHEEFARCLEHLNTLCIQQPGNAQIHARLALTQRSLGQMVAALASARRVVKLQPNHAEAWQLQGELLAAQGLDDAAIAAFDRALVLNSASYEALLGKARSLETLYGEQRPVSTAAILRPVERAVALQPERTDGLNTLARMLFTLTGEVARATTLARKSLRLNPESAYPHLILAEIMLASPTAGQLTEAAEHAQAAAERDTRNPEPLYLLGKTRWRQRRVKEAIAALERSLRIRSLPQTVYLLSLAYQRDGQPDRARRFAEVYRRWNGFLEQRKVLQAALRHRPRDLELHCRFAELYLSTGDVAPAENWLRKAELLAPKSPRVRQLWRGLEEQKRNPPPHPFAVDDL